jgi:hypothetical protein
MHLPTLPSHRNEALRLLKAVCLGPGVVLVHDLPTKTAHRATTALRGSIRRAARYADGFRIYGALFTDILRGLINGRTIL